MEIQKINSLKENLPEEEKVEVNNALNVLAKTYKAMIREAFLEGEEIDYDEAIKSLQTLRRIAKKEETSFPNITNKDDAIVYIVKMGNEILLSKVKD